MKPGAIWLGSVTLVLLVLALIAGLGFYKYAKVQEAMQTPPPPEQPIRVRFAEATAIDFQQEATMIGTVLAPRSIQLSNEIAGTVVATNLQPGQVVEAGQLLVELDASVERAQLESAIARRRIAESTLSRIRDAAQARAVTPSELEEAEALFSQADAQVAELNAVIERKTLRAPFRARLGLSDTHEGQFLPSGSPITTLQSIDEYVHVDFMVPQIASDSVSVGQQVVLQLREQPFGGEVIAIDAQADRQSRNVMARARLMNPPAGLRPGDSLKVLVAYGPHRKTPAVPEESLQSAPMQTFVYVVQEVAEGELRAREQPVEAGPTIGSRLSILSGLEVGQRVVADGAFKLRDGALIAAAPDPSREQLPTERRVTAAAETSMGGATR